MRKSDKPISEIEQNRELADILGVKRQPSKRKKRSKFVTIMIIIFGFLSIILGIVTFYSFYAGNYTLLLDNDLAQKGILMSKTSDFADGGNARLYAKARSDLLDVSYLDLNITAARAANGDYVDPDFRYLAYTFYLKNTGKEAIDINYSVDIVDVTKNFDAAIRIMVIESDVDHGNEKQSVFMKEDEIAHTYPNGYPQSTLNTFYSDKVIARDKISKLEIGMIRKFTFISWLEGDDPDCVDEPAERSIMGGKIKMKMDFKIASAELGW